MPPFPSLLLDLSDSPGALPRAAPAPRTAAGAARDARGMRGSGALEREFRAGRSGRSSQRC